MQVNNIFIIYIFFYIFLFYIYPSVRLIEHVLQAWIYLGILNNNTLLVTMVKPFCLREYWKHYYFYY